MFDKQIIIETSRSVSRRYRNRRIGEFLKELDLTEGRSTGVPKMLRAMAVNGSPLPRFETDDDRLACVVRLPAHPLAQRLSVQETDQDTDQVTLEVARLLSIAAQGEHARSALQEALGLKHTPNFRRIYLLPALSKGLIEMTLPDKPNSRSQRYRLTAKGKKWLQTHGKRNQA
jgi:ATP-dependent DNA helicase RecG